MMQDAHQNARQLIALGRTQDLAEAQQVWLTRHLETCSACRDYAQAAAQIVLQLRTIPLTADARLVRVTQMRVRFHAARLRETRERMWIVGMACLAVGLSATVTAPLLWRVCAWIGAWAGVSAIVWQAGFMTFFVVPALVVSVLLLLRGTHMAYHGQRPRE